MSLPWDNPPDEGESMNTATPVKAQVQITADGVEVVKTIPGVVGVVDKVKGYYKSAIAALGTLLILLNTLTPTFAFLGGDFQHWFTIAVALVTTVSVFLKSNEHWVDQLSLPPNIPPVT